jgi:uncharacterized protein (TIGR03086 family)
MVGMSDTTTTADPRPALAAAFAAVEEAIARLGADDLDRPTPCSDMTVRELLGHLVMAGERAACAGRRVPLAEWPMAGPDLTLDGWLPRWSETAATAKKAWADDALLGEMMALPWGQFVGSSVVSVYTNELLVHGWDLATAIRVTLAWDQGAIAVAADEMHRQLPEPDRGPLWSSMAAMMPPGVPWEDPFANAVDVTDDAAPIERLVAWSGRDPYWSPS